MSYLSHYQHADDIINHLNVVLPSINDPLLSAKYVGFVAVSAVTVYELAVKTIFVEFAGKKHKVLGSFVDNFFKRINGRIKIQVIKDDYIRPFGKKYVDNFDRLLKKSTATYLSMYGRDIKNSYGNLITWRNDFAHEGRISQTATYAEVVQAYSDGKEVIKCVSAAMNR